MTLSTNFITWLKLCCRCVHVIKVWQHRNERSYHNLNFIRILSGKPLFCAVVLVKVQLFGAETRYGLVLFNQYGKRFKSKSQKVNSYVFKSYRGITKIELICPPLHPYPQCCIGLRVSWHKYKTHSWTCKLDIF